MHDLRHSMASNMVNSRRSIYEVAKVLGHTQLKTSAQYSHLSNETLLAAVDAAAEATGGTNWRPPSQKQLFEITPRHPPSSRHRLGGWVLG